MTDCRLPYWAFVRRRQENPLPSIPWSGTPFHNPACFLQDALFAPAQLFVFHLFTPHHLPQSVHPVWFTTFDFFLQDIEDTCAQSEGAQDKVRLNQTKCFRAVASETPAFGQPFPLNFISSPTDLAATDPSTCLIRQQQHRQSTFRDIVTPLSQITMATLTRQPFAPVDGARLQSLTSIKNRQNCMLEFSQIILSISTLHM